MSDWQPIKTAPKESPVLICSSIGFSSEFNIQIAIGVWDGECKTDDVAIFKIGTRSVFENDEFEDITEVMMATHWMPLPEPPK